MGEAPYSMTPGPLNSGTETKEKNTSSPFVLWNRAEVSSSVRAGVLYVYYTRQTCAMSCKSSGAFVRIISLAASVLSSPVLGSKKDNVDKGTWSDDKALYQSLDQ